MASLTESFLISDVLDDSNKENTKNNWFDTIYLCVEKSSKTQRVNGFNCFLFPTYEKAYNYYERMNLNKENKRTTIITMCKWVPYFFHPFILNRKLKKLYWNNNVTIMRPINKKWF